MVCRPGRLAGGRHRRALVIGAEVFSRILDWNDRGTCVLFGDGAGAVVLRAANGGAGSPSVGNRPRGILSTHLHSDGRFRDILYVDGGPSSTQTVGYLRMSGKEVFRHAVASLVAVAEEAVAANDLALADRQVDIEQHLAAAIARLQLLDFQHHASPSPR